MSLQQELVLRGANVIDGTGRPPLEDYGIHVRDGRIVAVGPTSTMPDVAPDGVIDCHGRSVVPGLIDVHTHWYSDRDLAAYVSRGVTSVRFAGVSQSAVETARARAAVGEIASPRLYSSGRMVDLHPPAWEEWGVGVRSVEDAGQVVEALVREDRVDCVLVAQRLEPQLITKIIEVAHSLARPVVGQIWYTDGRQAAEAGIDQLDNTSRIFVSDDYPVDRLMRFSSIAERIALFAGAWATVNWDETRRTMEVMLTHGVAFCPTIIAWQIAWPEVFVRLEGTSGFDAAYSAAERDSHARLMENTQGPWSKAEHENLRRAVENISQWCGEFHVAGGTVLGGTDTHFAGFALHHEVENLAECGLSSLEVIAALTSRSAAAMGVTDVGTIRPDAHADLLVLNGDPVKDLRVLRSIDSIILNGVPLGPGPNHLAPGADFRRVVASTRDSQ